MRSVPHDLDPQLLKGVLTLLLLHLLAERESYGYEVVQRLHEVGLPEVAAGTVYPALSRLERERRLTSRLVASDEGPAASTTDRPPPGSPPSPPAQPNGNRWPSSLSNLARPIDPPKGSAP